MSAKQRVNVFLLICVYAAVTTCGERGVQRSSHPAVVRILDKPCHYTVSVPVRLNARLVRFHIQLLKTSTIAILNDMVRVRDLPQRWTVSNSSMHYDIHSCYDGQIERFSTLNVNASKASDRLNKTYERVLSAAYCYVVAIGHLVDNELSVTGRTDYTDQLWHLLSHYVKKMLCDLEQLYFNQLRRPAQNLLTRRVAENVTFSGPRHDSDDTVRPRMLDIVRQAYDVLHPFTTDYLPFIVDFEFLYAGLAL